MSYCTAIDSQPTINLKLTPDHQAHIAARRIYAPWAEANCMSCDIPKASVILRYEAKSPGIMLVSDEYGQWQFKPDEPWASTDGKLPKYRTGKGEYDAFLAKHPEIKAYWSDLDALKVRCFTIDGKPYLLITEGGFKAITGCQHNLPTIGLVGVTMAMTPKAKGKPDLIPALKRFAEAGFGFIIAFDADAATNKNVRFAEKKLAKVLLRYGCEVRTITGHWKVEDGKGMDDFINNKGIEEFRAVLMKAQSWGVQARDTRDSDVSATKKPPTPQVVTARLAEEFGHQLKYDEEQQTWRKWSGKHWEKMGLGAFKSWLKNTLDGKGVSYGGSAYLDDVRKLLECDLRQLKWQFWDKSRYINFSNCVFDGAEAKPLEHLPGMGFTSYLPYEYKPLTGDLSNTLEALRVNCPNIHEFFRTAMQGDERKMFKLLAIVNAVLKHRFFDLQMFVHLVGAPGSGKGKFSRFLQKLVGKDNNIACQLDKLGDGSTKASLIDKQLVVFPDERKPVGIDSILSLTGGDEISYRELYQRATSAHFYGSLIICSNKPIFIGDTTGLERRLCLVGFDNPIATEKRDHSLEAQLDNEIPACIAIALSLANSAVTQAIQGKGVNQIVEYKAKEWEMKVEVNSVAAFLDAGLVLDPTATCTAGNLYGAYKEFCEAGGLSKFSIVKFPRLLADILADENLPATRHQGRIAYFQGLRLRAEGDTHPTHSETLAGVDAGVSGSLAGVDAGVKPLPDIHQRELRELDTKCLEKSANDDFLPDEEESDLDTYLEKDSPPSTPATTANPLAAKDITPAVPPAKLPQSPPSTPATIGVKHRDFKVGGRVVISEKGNIHEGQHGTVTHIGYGSRETDYQIKLDKVSHNAIQITVSIPKSALMPALYLMNL
ncbi:DUF3854 domain-containing protein [Microcoleus sp. MON2_D5]|uniref:DUF3854 domain-containing protein n=1 Tax=Microcoleus sp. MON2_D5 TaxID=2818833 RepID=UPI002FD436AE